MSFIMDNNPHTPPSMFDIAERCDFCFANNLTCDVNLEQDHGCTRCRYGGQECMKGGRQYPIRTQDPPMLTVNSDLKICEYCSLMGSRDCDVDVEAGTACTTCTFRVPGGCQCVVSLMEMQPRPFLRDEHSWDHLRQLCDACFVLDKEGCCWMDDPSSRQAECANCLAVGQMCTRGGVQVPLPQGAVFNPMVFGGQHDLQVDEDITPFGGGYNIQEADGDVNMFAGDVNMLAGDVNMFEDVDMGGMDFDIPANDMNSPNMFPSPEAQVTQQPQQSQQPQQPQVPAPQAAAQSVSPWGRPNLTTNFLQALVALDDQPSLEPVAGPSRSPAQLRQHAPANIIHQEFFPFRLLTAPFQLPGEQPPNVPRANVANQGGRTRPGNQARPEERFKCPECDPMSTKDYRRQVLANHIISEHRGGRKLLDEGFAFVQAPVARVQQLIQGQQGNGYQPQGGQQAPFAHQPQRQQGQFFQYQAQQAPALPTGQVQIPQPQPGRPHPKLYDCEYCNFGQANARSMKLHMRTAHPHEESPEFEADPKVQCPHCHQLFMPRGLGSHIKIKHPGMERPDLQWDRQ